MALVFFLGGGNGVDMVHWVVSDEELQRRLEIFLRGLPRAIHRGGLAMTGNMWFFDSFKCLLCILLTPYFVLLDS
jgi:hypothetical protein